MGTLAFNSGDALPSEGLSAALAGLPQGAPVAIMVHGFRYCPSSVDGNPHRLILGDDPISDNWKIVSWPRRLGLAGEAGLAIGFGWSARGTIWQAYGAAPEAGQNLSRLLSEIARLSPRRPVHLIAHSLGARVVLHALSRVAPGAVGRVVLISPAAFRGEAEQLARSPGARGTEVISVLSRENNFYDLMLRAALPHCGATLGGGGPNLPGWLDLRLDDDAAIAALAQLGHRIAASTRKVCHWSGYLRPGIWAFYRELLSNPSRLTMPLLRSALSPELSDMGEAATALGPLPYMPRPRALPKAPRPSQP